MTIKLVAKQNEGAGRPWLWSVETTQLEDVGFGGPPAEHTVHEHGQAMTEREALITAQGAVLGLIYGGALDDAFGSKTQDRRQGGVERRSGVTP